MTKAPIDLQDLRRRIYAKAKAEPSWRFWGLYVHVCKVETLQAAYKLAKENNGSPGIDGVTFDAVESVGRTEFLEQLREELSSGAYVPQRVRKVGIPKSGGRLRTLSIPTIRDRVVQGALKLILEPIFEADFQPGSFGYRPKRSAHRCGGASAPGDSSTQDPGHRCGSSILLRQRATSSPVGEGRRARRRRRRSWAC